MNTPFWNALTSNQSTFKPKQASKVLYPNQNLVVILCSRSNSHHLKLQQFCRELELCYALAAKSHSDPEIVKITNNNEWTLHSEMPLHINLSQAPSNQSKLQKLPKNQTLVIKLCSRSNSHHMKTSNNSVQNWNFCNAPTVKAPSDPEVVKISNEHSILNIMLQKQLSPYKNNSVAM